MKCRDDRGTSSLVVIVMMSALFTISAPSSADTLRPSPIHAEAFVVNAAPPPAMKPRQRVNRVRDKPPISVRRPEPKLDARLAVRPLTSAEQSARQPLAFGASAAYGTSSTNPNLPPHIMQNLRGPATPDQVEMGNRPARSLGLCGDGKTRRFLELDTKTVAALLPDFNSVRPRTICAKRGVLIADYAFK